MKAFEIFKAMEEGKVMKSVVDNGLDTGIDEFYIFLEKDDSDNLEYENTPLSWIKGLQGNTDDPYRKSLFYENDDTYYEVINVLKHPNEYEIAFDSAKEFNEYKDKIGFHWPPRTRMHS